MGENCLAGEPQGGRDWGLGNPDPVLFTERKTESGPFNF